MDVLTMRDGAPTVGDFSDLMKKAGYNSALDFLASVGQSRGLKAEAIAAALYALTGERPQMTQGTDAHGGYTQITPSKRQNEIMVTMISEWLAKSPGDVRLDLSGVFLPILLKRGWPYMLGMSAVGFGVGKAL